MSDSSREPRPGDEDLRLAQAAGGRGGFGLNPDARWGGGDGPPRPGGATLAGWMPVVVGRIAEGFDPLKVVLFGSVARGEAERDSDLDLLVVVPEAAVGEAHDDDQRRLAVDIRRALKDLPVSKDVVVSTPGEIARRGEFVGTVLRRALLEGEVLYERTLQP